VDQVLSAAFEADAKAYLLRSRGMDVDQMAERVVRLRCVSVNAFWSAGRYKKIVAACCETEKK
jgi:hypothetical protein